MAKIPLRAYNREIENLIDSGQTEEAIAHCRHILNVFPKHVETYRLLGKAFLETQRYGDASDILQRVLSSSPDDFVSHVGMSIIREDEGNLDQAIWHMERAFEIQPANGAIQEELRRLYGRRDGFEPPRVRLTRGALARMYVRGDLYQQAIAELRAALAEDPQRIDLQVLLGEAYAKAGMRAEAAEIGSAILKKLPYCIGALRTMSSILAGTERGENTQVYRQRLGVLDPYVLHTGAHAPTAERVPENAVTLEKLDWQAGQLEPGREGQPEWAASLGIKLNDGSEKESLPDWMNTGSQAEENEEDAWSAAVTRGTGMLRSDRRGELEANRMDEKEETPDWISSAASPAEPTPEDQIPDWMKDAGWAPSTGAFQEGPLSFDDQDEEAADEGGIFSADMPEWLRGMTPNLSEKADPDPAVEEDNDWLTPPSREQAQTGQPADSGRDWVDESSTPTSQPNSEDANDWLAELDQAASDGDQAAEAPEKTDVPDWLKEFGLEPEGSSSSSSEEDVPQTELPDWLSEISSPVDETQAIPNPMSETVPSWLTGFGEEETVEEPIDEEEAARAETIPSWLQGLDGEQAIEEPVQDELAPQVETTPPWLHGLGDLEEADDAEMFDTPVETEEPAQEASAADLPDWMAELVSPEQTSPAEPAEGSAEIPDWMAELTKEDQLVEAEAEAEDAGELPDWLREVDTVEEYQESSSEGEILPVSSHPDADITEWMAELDTLDTEETVLPSETEQVLQPEAAEGPAGLFEEETSSQEETQPVRSLVEPEQETAPQVEEGAPAGWFEEETPGADETQPMRSAIEANLETASPPDQAMEMEDMDAAFAWLESLAVKQGASEALLLTPEERREDAPDWVDELSEREAQAVVEEPASAEQPDTDLFEAEQPLSENPEESFVPEVLTAEEGLASSEQPEDEDTFWFFSQDDQAVEDEAALESAGLADFEDRLGVEEQRAAEGQPVNESYDLPEWMLEDETLPSLAETIPSGFDRQEFEERLAEEPSAAEEQMSVEEPIAVKERDDTASEEQEAAVEPQTAAEPAAEMDLNDMDAAFAWLESLAVKQGASEALLLTPEERRENAPDWVEKLSERVEQTAFEEPASVEDHETDLFEEDLVPEEIEAEAPTLISRPVELDEELVDADIPAWLLEEDEAAPVLEGDTKPVHRLESVPAVEPTPQAEEMEDLYAAFSGWDSQAVEQVTSEGQEFTSEQESQLPTGLDELDETEADQPTTIELPATEEPDLAQDTPSWLRDLGAEEGISEGAAEGQVGANLAEEQSELIGWLDDAVLASDEQAGPVEETPVQASPLPELPDWLAGEESTDKLDWTPPAVQEKLVRRLDLNLASLAELERLPGVGFRMAQAIVNYRETYGPFKKVNDLFEVRGFSPSTLDFIQDRVYVEAPPEPEKSVSREPSGSQWTDMQGVDLPDYEGEAPAELVQARDALLSGNVDESAALYDQLIRARQNLAVIVIDLQSAVQRMPNEVLLWQALGDAHMRLDHLQDALNAYTKAEDLLR